MKKLTSRQLSVISGLAAISAVTQLIHIGYQSPQWGMWLDIVAVTWLTAFFLYNTKAAFLVSVLGALIITLFAPSTWLGASMKWTATLPIWLFLGLYLKLKNKKLSTYSSIKPIIIPLIFGLIARSLLLIPLNYYFAIPIWTGMTPAIAIKAIPWFIIAIFNTAQGIIDVFLAWIIVYRFKLNRFAK